MLHMTSTGKAVRRAGATFFSMGCWARQQSYSMRLIPEARNSLPCGSAYELCVVLSGWEIRVFFLLSYLINIVVPGGRSQEASSLLGAKVD